MQEERGQSLFDDLVPSSPASAAPHSPSRVLPHSYAPSPILSSYAQHQQYGQQQHSQRYAPEYLQQQQHAQYPHHQYLLPPPPPPVQALHPPQDHHRVWGSMHLGGRGEDRSGRSESFSLGAALHSDSSSGNARQRSSQQQQHSPFLGFPLQDGSHSNGSGLNSAKKQSLAGISQRLSPPRRDRYAW